MSLHEVFESLTEGSFLHVRELMVIIVILIITLPFLAREDGEEGASPTDEQWWRDLQGTSHLPLVIPPSCCRLSKGVSSYATKALKRVKQIGRSNRKKKGKRPSKDNLTAAAASDSDSMAGSATEGEKSGSSSSTFKPLGIGSSSGSGEAVGTAGDFAAAAGCSSSSSMVQAPAARPPAVITTDAGAAYEVANLPEGCTPLLVFVNGRSGANQGRVLIHQLRKLLNPLQVVDVTIQEPRRVLAQFSHLPRLRVLVCGGDGTVGWVLNSVDELGLEQRPPLAVLPLGTGNDLARVLGWGSGYQNESLLEFLREVYHAHVTLLDRWAIEFEDNAPLPKDAAAAAAAAKKGGGGGAAKGALQRVLTRSAAAAATAGKGVAEVGGAAQDLVGEKVEKEADGSEGTPASSATVDINGAVVAANGAGEKGARHKRLRYFNNYYGLGVDAQAALRFHHLRESRPQLFFNRVVNKAWYTALGTQEMFRRSSVELAPFVTLEVTALASDGLDSNNNNNSSGAGAGFHKVDIPAGVQGLIFMNIASYSGGVTMWKPPPQAAQGEADRAAVDSPRSVRSGSGGAAMRPHSMQDGMLDVVAINGVFHLGQLQVGLSKAVMLCQCRSARLTTTRAWAMHVDGEPWGEKPCSMVIKARKEKAHMLQRTVAPGGIVAGQFLQTLESAVERNIITAEQQRALLEEFSGRIERYSGSRRDSMAGNASVETAKGFGGVAMRRNGRSSIFQALVGS